MRLIDWPTHLDVTGEPGMWVAAIFQAPGPDGMDPSGVETTLGRTRFGTLTDDPVVGMLSLGWSTGAWVTRTGYWFCGMGDLTAEGATRVRRMAQELNATPRIVTILVT